MFQAKHGLASEVFESMFVINSHSAKLRSKSDFCVPKFITEYFGKNLIRYLGPVIWNSLHWTIKGIVTLFDGKESIKKWKLYCPCSIFKNYISGFGFLNPHNIFR